MRALVQAQYAYFLANGYDVALIAKYLAQGNGLSTVNDMYLACDPSVGYAQGMCGSGAFVFNGATCSRGSTSSDTVSFPLGSSDRTVSFWIQFSSIPPANEFTSVFSYGNLVNEYQQEFLIGYQG